MGVKSTTLILLATVGMAMAQSPGVGPLTVPQSSLPYQNGLHQSPQPGFMTSQGTILGNDIVTGNVSGGKQFRGVVPYGSPSYFQNYQGSATLDNFNRRAAGADTSIQPYYSPTRVVTGIQGSTPVNSQIYQTTPSLRASGGVNTYGLVPLEEAQKLLNPNAPIKPEIPLYQQYGTNRPLTMTPQELEQYINKELQGKLQPTEVRQQQTEQFKKNLEEVKQQAEELKKKLNEPQNPDEPTKAINSEVTSDKENVMPVKTGQEGVFEEMAKRKQEDFRKSLEEIGKQRKTTEPYEVNIPKQAPASEENEPGMIRKSFSEMEPGMNKAIIGYSKTFATESKDRFNELMKTAEQYIKEKKFYKAADAYTVASAYQSANPLPYAGKAHALFGAGEYMSSAYFLSRAIQIWPDYARFKVDITSLFGDKDLLESRIAEITNWQDRTGSGELLFLLSYVYYQTDQMDKALMAINGAKVKLPESKAVDILDKVIHQAAEESKQAGKQ